jgi:hypothetical protein
MKIWALQVLLAFALLAVVVAIGQGTVVQPWVEDWGPIDDKGYGAVSALVLFLLKAWTDAKLDQARPFAGNQALSIVTWVAGVGAVVAAAISAASGSGQFGNSVIVWGAFSLLVGLTLRVVANNLPPST